VVPANFNTPPWPSFVQYGIEIGGTAIFTNLLDIGEMQQQHVFLVSSWPARGNSNTFSAFSALPSTTVVFYAMFTRVK
jgi:hypothetical protein